MARRRRYVVTPRQPPLTKWMPGLEIAVMNLRDRVIDRERLELTQQEMLDLLVPEEYHEPLRTVSKIVRHSYYLDHDYKVEWNGKAVVRFDCPTLLAINSDIAVQPFSPTAQRVDAWLDRRLELAREFGRVLWLVRQLNDHCKTLGQVRYYWPAILTLCSANDQLEALADKLRAASGANAPPLPTNVRTVCGLAAGIVTAASLLDAGDIPDSRGVKVDIVRSGTTGYVQDEYAGTVPLL